MVEYLRDMIDQEGRLRRRQGLGKMYSYDLVDKPFMQGDKYKSTKYVIPLTNAKGEKKYLVGSSAQDAIDKFKLEHASGWNEATASYDDMGGALREKQNELTTYVAQNFKDLGDLPASAYPAPPVNPDPKKYVWGGPSGTGSLDWLTNIIMFLRSIGIK
jgi:hypothetical protein